MNPEQLQKILDNHKLWLNNDPKGKRANLNGAYLERADLEGANLERANLNGAHLNGAHLYGANLNGAYLNGAYLERANLNGAHLNGAHLYGANLERANLKGAYLERANLNGAHLYGANLDFSCWPLWCGSFGVKVDDKILVQLFCHVARLDVTNCSPVIKYSHRLIFSTWPGKWLKNLFCEYRDDVKEI